MSTDVLQGEVNWFGSEKGYGFISYLSEQDGKQKDVFVHYSGIKMDGYKRLGKGDKVQFVIVEGDKGPQAVNVVVTERAPLEDGEKSRRYESKTKKKH